MGKPLKTSQLIVGLLLLFTVCLAIVFAFLVFIMTMREYTKDTNEELMEITIVAPDTLNTESYD